MIERTMNAIRLHALGDPDTLAVERIDTPEPGPGEVLVRVHAAAITRDELDWPEGRLPAIPSYEFSGVVADTGTGVGGFAPGDPVYALGSFDRDGAAAEYTVVPHAFLAPKPHRLDDVQSAAIPLAALSAWQGLFEHGTLKAGERVLIHGAAGGVGGFAVQLARAQGAHVIGTTSKASIQAAIDLGANEVIDQTTDRFEDHVEPVDLVFDTTGDDRLKRSSEVVRAGGRIVSIATQPPQPADRSFASVYFVVEPNRDQLSELATLADNGQLRPTIDQVFPLGDAREAFKRTTDRDHHGKVVLLVSHET